MTMTRVTLEEGTLDENGHFKEWKISKSFLIRISPQGVFDEIKAAFRDIRDCIVLGETGER